MSFCYEMLHEIKKSLKEHSNQEYLNHINLLKLIKEDITEEKQKFKERSQGVEVSLFIENIYSVDYLESKNTSDPDELTSIVKNVMEKKNLIEKLQEKMSERLGVINNLLANHVIAHVPHFEEKTEPHPSPSIVKNNIKLINLNLGQTKYNYNFYKNPIHEHQYDWSKAFKKNPQYKVKKSLTRTRANFKSKRHASQMSVNNYNNAKIKALDPHRSLQVKETEGRNSSEKTKKNNTLHKELLREVKGGRRKSIDGFKNLVNHFFEPNEDDNDDETPQNVRYYYDPKSNPNTENPYVHNIASRGSKLSEGMSPIRVDEESLFPTDIREYNKRPIKIGDLIQIHKKNMSSKSKRYGNIKPSGRAT